MAATIVLTAGINIVPPNDDQLHKLCDHILDSLRDRDTLNIAAQCCRTLLTHHPKTATDQELVRYFLPKLINFVAEESPVTSQTTFTPVASILTAQFLNSLTVVQQEVAVSLFVPMLLERARRNPVQGRETAARLLELAQVNREVFRNVVANLEQGHRTFMEEILRSNVGEGGQEQHVGRGVEKPSIELKMNFGS